MTSPYQQPQYPQQPQAVPQGQQPQGYPPPQYPQQQPAYPPQQPYTPPPQGQPYPQQPPQPPQQPYAPQQPQYQPYPQQQPYAPQAQPQQQPQPLTAPKPGHPDWPTSGAPGVEEFRPPQKIVVKLFIAWIPILIPQFAVWTLLVALVPQVFGLKPPVVADFAGGVLATVVSSFYLYGKMKKGALSTVVRVSPAGIEMTDNLGFLNRVSWPDMVKVGRVTATQSQGSVKGGGGKTFTASAMKDMGVIGWGVRRVPENLRLPETMRTALARMPYDPATGKHYISIPLSVIEADWVDGRIAQLIQHYRPDLSWDMHAEEFGSKSVKL